MSESLLSNFLFTDLLNKNINIFTSDLLNSQKNQIISLLIKNHIQYNIILKLYNSSGNIGITNKQQLILDVNNKTIYYMLLAQTVKSNNVTNLSIHQISYNNLQSISIYSSSLFPNIDKWIPILCKLSYYDISSNTISYNLTDEDCNFLKLYYVLINFVSNDIFSTEKNNEILNNNILNAFNNYFTQQYQLIYNKSSINNQTLLLRLYRYLYAEIPSVYIFHNLIINNDLPSYYLILALVLKLIIFDYTIFQSINNALNSQIAWGIFAGLVVGKPLGVLITVLIGKKIGVSQFPQGAKSVDLLATGSAAGIGFTVAIFIANLAFTDPVTQDLAVFAVIVASLVSALISLFLFKFLAGKKS